MEKGLVGSVNSISHAAWFATAIRHPAGFFCGGCHVKWRKGSTETWSEAAAIGGAVAPALWSLALWFLC